MKRALRVHHLLCIPLFRGSGYSDAFSRNMEEQIKWFMAHADEEILLVCGPDGICQKCPNLKEETFCREADDKVTEKDRRLCEALHLEEGGYTFHTLMAAAAERVTEQIFTESCKNCEWRKQGLCSWQAYRESLKNFV